MAEVIDTAVGMGIPRNAPGLDPNLSIVLGSATVSPIDMANAYGTIADGGLAKKWYVVDKKRGESFSPASIKVGYKGYFDKPAREEEE